MVWVENIQPVPVPGLTLPMTRQVLPTRDNHYLQVQCWTSSEKGAETWKQSIPTYNIMPFDVVNSVLICHDFLTILPFLTAQKALKSPSVLITC